MCTVSSVHGLCSFVGHERCLLSLVLRSLFVQGLFVFVVVVVWLGRVYIDTKTLRIIGAYDAPPQRW